MKPWCDNLTCTYNGEHDHFGSRGEVSSNAGWCAPTVPYTWNDPGPPPPNLDGDPTKCANCWGTGSVPSTTCACPDCDAHRTRVQCDDCDGAGAVTPMTTAEWEAYAARVRAGDPLADVPEISVGRGGLRFPLDPRR